MAELNYSSMDYYSSMDQLKAIMSGDQYKPVPRDSAATFEVKGGGPQTIGAGGMVRSAVGDKTDFSLALDGAMFRRWADHLTRATRPPASYPKRNWLKATTGDLTARRATMERAKESAVRHFMQWYRGDSDEDHAAAVFFNINVHETVKEVVDEDL